MQENKITGVNMDAGLDLYDEEMDIYLSVMKSFVTNAPAVLEKLRNVTAESLPGYIINVHGMKSMSAAIAAEEISDKAKKLELMAKAGDLSGVQYENEAFVEQVKALITNVQSWLAKNEANF